MKEGGGANPISCNPLFSGRLFCAAPQKRAGREERGRERKVGKRRGEGSYEKLLVISNY
jgi:hypothetical protein